MKRYYPWTFGIVTDGLNPERLQRCIHSIIPQTTGTDQIIVVGGDSEPDGICPAEFVWIPFNENIKKGWITKKKNLIANLAINRSLCIMHDYVSLTSGWRKGFEQFFAGLDHNWITVTNPITNLDGKRFRDWCVIYNDAWMNPPIDDQKPPENIEGHLLQYYNNSMGRWQYYSGAYFCVQRDILQHIPLDENRIWGQGEDVQWCRLLYKEFGQDAFAFNPHSEVKFLKQKDRAPWEAFSPL